MLIIIIIIIIIINNIIIIIYYSIYLGDIVVSTLVCRARKSFSRLLTYKIIIRLIEGVKVLYLK